MRLVDSHCHLNMLDLAAYQGSLKALIDQAKEVGVIHILCVGVDLEHGQEVIDIAAEFPHVSASVGVHPSEKTEIDKDQFLTLAEHPKVVAIGETGLDYYYNDSGLDEQKLNFKFHIEIAKALQKPLIIHSRSAREDTIRILKEEGAKTIGGVMHCFTEDWTMAQQALNLGFYISFSGIVTFKNAFDVAEVAKKVPLDRILIETDAPYLTPVPHRGKKPNEPQYVGLVAAKIAELKGLSVEEVANASTENFFSLFKKA